MPVLASAAGYYFANSLGATPAVSWSQRIHPVEVFRKHFAWAGPGFLAGASISAGLLWVVTLASFHTSVLLPLAYLVYYSFAVRWEQLAESLGPVWLSIGQAVFPADGDDGGLLLAAAARRLSAGEHSLPAAGERLPSTPKGVD